MSELVAGGVVAGPEHSYRLERELGRGGFGVTWLAARESDGALVALKQLHASRISDRKAVELFQREGDVLRGLRHARIPDYVDDFVHGGYVLVQEFVDGQDLGHCFKGSLSLDEGQLIEVLAQVLEVLVYLHGRTPPVIHRDITPKNILLDAQKQAWLVDFGAVKLGLAGTMASTTTGTFGYSPMEQFVSKAYPQSDLYSLGMTCIAVAAGKEPVDLPFKGMRVDIRSACSLDARLVLLLERMTEPDPDRRLADAQLALEQLRPIRGRARRGLTNAGSTAVEPSVRDADLLPSERLREAALRVEQLAGDGMPVPDFQGHLDETESMGISADGAIVVAGRDVVDVEHMARLDRLAKGTEVDLAAVSPGGGVLAGIGERGAGQGVVAFERRDGRYVTRHTLAVGECKRCTISPDERTLAAITGFFSDREGDVLLFNLESGERVQRIEGPAESVDFSPDGRTMVVKVRDELVLMHSSGEEERLEDVSVVAWSHDGRLRAEVGEERVLFVPTDGGKSTQTKRLTGRLNGRAACFSPDGRWFALFDYHQDRILVIEVASTEVVMSLRDPLRDERMRSVEGMGFTPDGERLIVGCDAYFNRFSAEDEDCVAFWSVPDGRYLGALLDTEKGGLVAVSAEGFWGRLPEPDNKPDADSAEDPWNRPAVAQAALLGRPIDALIDSDTRAALADLDTRWAFFERMRAEEAVDGRVPTHRLVEAARGLTHLLDVLMERGRQGGSGATYGGGERGAPLTLDQINNAADALRALSPDERVALHAEQLARLEREEARDAARPKRAQARARPLVVTGPDGVPIRGPALRLIAAGLLVVAATIATMIIMLF